MGVLVVDDSVFMRMMIVNMLKKLDLNVVGEASNGIEAIQKYKELKPSLVTMDITMPELDGVSSIKEIIKIDPKAKIIVCSAMGQEAMVVEAIKAGARSFLVKPLEEERVLNEVKKLLGI